MNKMPEGKKKIVSLKIDRVIKKFTCTKKEGDFDMEELPNPGGDDVLGFS